MPRDPLTPSQCRAARALLRWSITRLAEASGVGATTIGNFEMGRHRPINANRLRLRQVMEEAGVIFLEDEGANGGPGVRYRPGASPD